jgi:hypothetical protein
MDGKYTVKDAPEPGSLFTVIYPPFCFVIPKTVVSPIPRAFL